jgi:hypothetical protein
MRNFSLLFLSMLLYVCGNCQSVHDTVAIKILLEKESATWRSGDEKAHATCWHIQPYSRILVSTATGQCFDVPPSMMIKPTPGMMGQGGHAVNSNYKFSIQDNSAWVSHDEVSTSPDGTKTYSHEMRMLEKINGLWKIVGQSIHMYKPD